MNTRMIGFLLGRILMVEAGLLALPLLTALLYGEPLMPWLATMLVLAAIGGALSLRKPERTALYAKDGFVATHGWLETSEVRGVDFCRRLRDTGVKTVIYTDISRDGKMQGTNLELYKELSQIEGLDIVASGGISSLKEIDILKNEVYGAILGKALYLGAIDLKEALKYSV